MTRNSQHGTQKPSAWYALGLKIKLRGKLKLELSKISFRWRAAEDYNSMPMSIRDIGDLAVFKKALKLRFKIVLNFS